MRERKRQDFIMACGDKAPPEPLTELVAMQNPEKPGTWTGRLSWRLYWSSKKIMRPCPNPINLPEYIVDC